MGCTQLPSVYTYMGDWLVVYEMQTAEPVAEEVDYRRDLYHELQIQLHHVHLASPHRSACHSAERLAGAAAPFPCSHLRMSSSWQFQCKVTRVEWVYDRGEWTTIWTTIWGLWFRKLDNLGWLFRAKERDTRMLVWGRNSGLRNTSDDLVSRGLGVEEREGARQVLQKVPAG